MGDETTASIEAAAQAFAEAVDTWREQAVGAPDLFLEATMRLQESIDVPLAGHGNGIKPGRVERRITLWPRLRGVPVMTGEPFMDVTATTITHGIWTIIGMIREATALGTMGSRARHEWEHAYYLRLRGTPTVVMCAGCRAFGARATEEDVPEGWSRAADDPDELWCGACTNQAGP
jgi:hypothetical protein